MCKSVYAEKHAPSGDDPTHNFRELHVMCGTHVNLVVLWLCCSHVRAMHTNAADCKLYPCTSRYLLEQMCLHVQVFTFMSMCLRLCSNSCLFVPHYLTHAYISCDCAVLFFTHICAALLLCTAPHCMLPCFCVFKRSVLPANLISDA
jgi:hypothetical protein